IPEGALRHASVAGGLRDVTKKNLARSLDYTIGAFETGGADMAIGSLKQGFDEYLSANEGKIREFKSIIERVSFTQLFQPVVTLGAGTAAYYEILARFERGEAREWIRLG